MTSSDLAMVGTPVFRMVVSSASMKKATATSQGRIRRVVSGRRSSLGSAGVNPEVL
ncbi:hypothetical protein [Asticcacaulis sp. MM231]|uniref:hypothetical protein n=1 Tax=Asticcacaulis sp. MM231 TaxID=3157666 RepID=UPI0032D58540